MRLFISFLIFLSVAICAPTPGAASYLEKTDYTLTNQSEADFSGQDLEGSSFAGAVVRNADFSGAKLHGAIFTQGAFAGSNFAGADLSDVLMDRTDFTGTNLSGTNLSGVVANGSSFANAEIEGADFTGALLDRDDQISLCRKAKGETRLSLDCP